MSPALNLTRKEPRLIEGFVRQLAEYEHTALTEGKTKVLDPELEDRLKALGYLD